MADHWYPAERILAGAAAEEWLDGATALGDSLLALPGRVTIDLTGLAVSRFRARLLRRVEALARVGATPRCTLQISAPQAARAGRVAALGQAGCHVMLRRDDLPGLKAQLQQWPDHWVPVFARPLAATAGVLGSEPGTVVSPGTRLCTPPGAAILPVSVHLLPYWSRAGLDSQRLNDALGGIVAAADTLLDELRWPLASDVWDGYRHRRLALVPRGLGDIVQLAGLASQPTAATRLLRATIALFQQMVRQHSRALAERRGCCAALDAQQALSHLRDRPDYRTWQQRWHDATAADRFRHRNLSAIALTDLWPGQTAGTRPVAWLPAALTGDGLAYGRRWDVLARLLRERPAFGRIAAVLTREA